MTAVRKLGHCNSLHIDSGQSRSDNAPAFKSRARNPPTGRCKDLFAPCIHLPKGESDENPCGQSSEFGRSSVFGGVGSGRAAERARAGNLDGPTRIEI